MDDQIGLSQICVNDKTPKAFQASILPLLDNSILLVDEKVWIREIADLKQNPGNHEVKLDFLTSNLPCLVTKNSLVTPDVSLVRSPDEDFAVDHLTTSSRFRDARTLHQAAVQEGDDRESMFEAKLGYLLPAVSTFYYIDQYFQKKLNSRNSGAWFLLEKLIKAGVKNIEIKSGATFGDFDDATKTKADYDRIDNKVWIQGQISSLLTKYAAKDVHVSISIFRKDSKGLPHDRLGFLNLRKNKQTFTTNRLLYFYIGPGVDLFKEPIIREKVSTAGDFELSDPAYLREVGSKCLLFDVISVRS